MPDLDVSLTSLDLALTLFVGVGALTLCYAAARILLRLFMPRVWTKGSPKLLLVFLALFLSSFLLAELPETTLLHGYQTVPSYLLPGAA
jgi:hypothetical protein